MMRTVQLSTAAALILGLLAFGCERREDRRAGRGGVTTDHGFMAKAAEANVAEIDAGRLAETKAASQDVRTFGQHMVEDHTRANAELSDLAQKKGIGLPTRPMEDITKDLADLNGADFDKKYVAKMVSEHEKAVTLFEENAKRTKDKDVRDWAEKTLPTLRHHLDMARDLNSKLGAPKAE